MEKLLFFHLKAVIKNERELDLFVDYLESKNLSFSGSWLKDRLVGIVSHTKDYHCNSMHQEDVLIFFKFNKRPCKISKLTLKYSEDPDWEMENV